MFQTTVKVSGMACSMCEAHINDAVRSALSVKKVSSAHTTGEVIIISEELIDEGAIRAAIDPTGYLTREISTDSYVKKGFSLFHK